MIPSSKRLAALVVVASAGAHLAGVGVVMREPAVQMAGGAEVAVASLGSSFADLSARVVQPEVVSPVETEAPEPPVQTAMAVTDAASLVEPPVTVAPVTPRVAVTPPVRPLAVTPPVMQTERMLPPVVPIAPPVAETPPVETADAPVAQAPAPPVEMQAALTPEVAPTPPVERTEAEPEPETPATSPRPPKRPETVAQKPRAKPAPTGNADRNARTGTDTGREEVKNSAAQSTQATRSQQAGNAAADNYPGQVMRRISRVPRPRVSVRAAATVSFSIAANGALASVSIARTSGSGELDAAALAVLRKAAPFPAPPSGARRQFTIRIEGR